MTCTRLDNHLIEFFGVPGIPANSNLDRYRRELARIERDRQNGNPRIDRLKLLAAINALRSEGAQVTKSAIAHRCGVSEGAIAQTQGIDHWIDLCNGESQRSA